MQLPLYYRLCAPPNLYLLGVLEEQSMKVSDNVPGSVYELEKGYIDLSVHQRIRRKLEEPRVQLSTCGLGRIFSSICCKFLGKLSNRGYVEL